MENIGRAFSYMFEDKDWIQKILIGGAFVLLSCLIIGIPFLLGYMLEVARRSSEGRELPLPEWDDWGERFKQGFMLLIIFVIYAIPLFIIHFILALIPCLGILFSILLSFAFGMIVPFIVVSFARSGKFEDAFDFNAMIEFFKANLVPLILVVALSWVLGIIAMFGILALFVGYFFTLFWSQLATYYLYGQVVRESEKSGAVVGAEAEVIPDTPEPPKDDEKPESGDETS